MFFWGRQLRTRSETLELVATPWIHRRPATTCRMFFWADHRCRGRPCANLLQCLVWGVIAVASSYGRDMARDGKVRNFTCESLRVAALSFQLFGLGSCISDMAMENHPFQLKIYRCKWRVGAPEMSSICIYLPRTAFQSREKLQGPDQSLYPLAICYSLLLKMAIEIVDLPIENGDFP